MKIVIDIDEDVIENAKSSPKYYPTYHFEKIWKAIVNGTPLPKQHGRLKDADELLKTAYQVYDEVRHMWTPDFVVNADDIDSALTIIEAEECESE